MRVFGLTGNICCGKSTVASLLGAYPDIVIIDSDNTSHPLTWPEIEVQVAASPDKICIVESASIFETQSEGRFLAVITAACNPREQLRRLVEERHISRKEIDERLAMQLPAQVKVDRAQLVIRTDCERILLAARVDNLYRILKKWKGA